jgi:hypothetical protein
MARKNNNNSVLKVIITDAAGVGCLLLVPVLGPLPGPGGIPLILAGFGFLAVNHDWADNAIRYVKKNSDNLLKTFFPDRPMIKWAWDVFSIIVLGLGLWLNLTAEWWLLKGLSYGVMASASTIFMLNRQRLDWLDKQLRRTGKR